MAADVGWLVLAFAGIGLASYLVSTRLRAPTVAPLTLLVFLPFHVLMVLSAAIFAGYLIATFQQQPDRWDRAFCYVSICCSAAAAVAVVWLGGINTLTEPRAFRASASEHANARAGMWLRGHYSGGEILMESYGNETVTFDSRISASQIIYEGSLRQWQPALRDPISRGIRWIYMRRAPGDQDGVWRALHGSKELAGYALVYADPDRLIYRER
jgi:hypothetical protein